jgi:hypothetical protein
MDRVSIRLEEEGPIVAIRMTRPILGIPLFKVHAFFVDGLLIDTGFTNGRKRFMKLCDRLRPTIVVNTHQVEKGFQQGLSPEQIRRKLLGRGDRFRFLTRGQISKQNLINAFLRGSPSSPGGKALTS